MVTAEKTLESILLNRVDRIEQLLEIDNKERKLVPLIMNPIQRDVITTVTGRDIYVKPGQVGFSSIKLADYFLDTITVPGTVSVILSHEEFITQRLLGKVKAYYNHLQRRIPSIPKLYHDSDNLKSFPDIHSSFYIGSARAYVFGRGETIHRLLCDEYAFWNPEAIARIMAPIMQRVPLSGEISVGSTPNGENNDFYEMYEAAKSGIAIGKSVFTSHFYPWFMHPEYAIPADSPYVLPGDSYIDFDNLNSDELKLATTHNLTFDQIRWRRRKISEMESLRRSGEMRILFQQEFPEDDVSCFLTAGDMAYDSTILNEMAKSCGKPNSIDNRLYIWYPPEKGLKYVVSIDPGVAKESETVTTVWHFWTADGKDYGKLCARLAGLIMPEEAGRRAILIAKQYNKAMITWDAASQGEAVKLVLKNYGNLYRRRDVLSGRISSDVGWLTSGRTKKYMYSQMVEMLPRLTINDINLVGQLRNMRYDAARGVLFSSGMDDYHDSAGIAICCRGVIPTKIGYAGQTKGWKW